jgi:hypothetical protein
MNWFLTVILCIVLVELLLRLPVAAIVSNIGLVSRKAVRTLAARRVSDHWKEKALLVYSRSLFVSSVKLGAVLLAAGAAIAAFVYLSDLLGAELFTFLVGWQGLLFSLAVASIYVTIRKRILPSPRR